MKMYSFNGRFSIRLDDKNRIRIPAKFKAELGSDYKLAFAPDKCIRVLPAKEYEKIIESFGDASFFDDEKQEAISAFSAMVYDVAEDPQGRVVIPQELVDYAEIEKDIVVSGAVSYLKIQAADRFAEKNAKLDMGGIYARLNAAKKQG